MKKNKMLDQLIYFLETQEAIDICCDYQEKNLCGAQNCAKCIFGDDDNFNSVIDGLKRSKK